MSYSRKTRRMYENTFKGVFKELKQTFREMEIDDIDKMNDIITTSVTYRISELVKSGDIPAYEEDDMIELWLNNVLFKSEEELDMNKINKEEIIETANIDTFIDEAQNIEEEVEIEEETVMEKKGLFTRIKTNLTKKAEELKVTASETKQNIVKKAVNTVKATIIVGGIHVMNIADKVATTAKNVASKVVGAGKKVLGTLKSIVTFIPSKISGYLAVAYLKATIAIEAIKARFTKKDNTVQA